MRRASEIAGNEERPLGADDERDQDGNYGNAVTHGIRGARCVPRKRRRLGSALDSFISHLTRATDRYLAYCCGLASNLALQAAEQK